MKYDIILSGVGGQGVLSLSAIIALSAMKEKLYVKQSEVHGMAQRGGAVVANLRLADAPIHSDLIPKSTASMILSMEPLESLRYLEYLCSAGNLVTSTDPVLNIPNYPDRDRLLEKIKLLPNSLMVNAAALAKDAGSVKSTNTVMLGAASHVLPLKEQTIKNVITELFNAKGEQVVKTNISAFEMGREVGK